MDISSVVEVEINIESVTLGNNLLGIHAGLLVVTVSKYYQPL